ncbi:MAG: NCS2 family permease [Chloroflexi bacterium]|nr:MAG: NCS2 family permease [Chloroflexota bacterium]
MPGRFLLHEPKERSRVSRPPTVLLFRLLLEAYVSTTAPRARSDTSALARHFRFAERNTDLRTEVLGGITTFFVMAYIIFLNPTILTLNRGAEPPLVPAFGALVTATCLAAAIATIAMGLYTNYPFAAASGLGLNAVVAFDLIATRGLPWQAAMGVIFIEGLLITLLVLTGFREAVLNAVPLTLKRAISVGIGLFILFIGLINAGFVRVPVETITLTGDATLSGPTPLGALGAAGVQLGAPATPVGIGNFTRLPVAVALLGLLLMLWLLSRRVKAALLLGIVLTTLIAVVIRLLVPGAAVSSVPTAANLSQLSVLPLDFSTIGSGFNFSAFNSPTAAAKGIGVVAALLVIFSLMLSDFFDTMGTIVGVGEEAGFVDEQGRLPGANRVLLIDSLAAALGGLFGVSSVTTYIESAAGVSEGARTGLASVVTGLLFLLALALAPFAGLVPPEATAPALIIVGFLMFAAVREIDVSNLLDGFPALITLIMMPLTFSITNGIGAGFVCYAFLRLVSGRAREIHPLFWVVSGAFVIYFLIPLLQPLT